MNENILSTIEHSIDRSVSILETVCPRNNACLGLKIRDTYHLNNNPTTFSLFTASEMLWAITSGGICRKSHYLIVELLTAINKEVNRPRFKQVDRILEKAYVLLAMTCAGQPISATEYTNVVSEILNVQQETGAWGTYSNGDSDLRATSLCLLALTNCYNYVEQSDDQPFCNILESITKACLWICKQYTDKGYCEREIIPLDSANHQSRKLCGTELTSWATLSLINALESICFEKSASEKINRNIQGSIKWMLTLDVNQIATTPEIETEKYILKDSNGDKMEVHDYGCGSLEILILTLIQYRTSHIYKYTKGLDKYINNAVLRFLKNEDNGKWYDKNTDSYNRMWTVSYAIKVLSSYQELIRAQDSLKKGLKKEAILKLSSVLNFLHKILNIKTITVTFCIALICLYMGLFCHDFIKARVEFLNLTAIGVLGLILSCIGIIISIYYGRKG